MANFRFHYSRVFEASIASILGKALAPNDIKVGKVKERIAQGLWDQHEKAVLGLFQQMYRTETQQDSGTIWLSLLLPNSFSDPLTVSIKGNPDIEHDPLAQKSLIAKTIHELAHYFSYSRPKDAFFNQLLRLVQERDLVGTQRGNLHYLIQAVEFGIMAELFGQEVGMKRRAVRAERGLHPDYKKSAQLLIDHQVPLDCTCLEFIEQKILSR